MRSRSRSGMPGPAIVDADHHALALKIRYYADGRSWRRIFQRIVDQLPQRKREQLRIGRDARQIGARIQAQRPSRGLRFEMLQDLARSSCATSTDSRSRRIFPASICDMRTASVTS